MIPEGGTSLEPMRVPTTPTLAVIGGGPKAVALAIKAKILQELGIADVSVVIVERRAIGAHWTGTAGFTNGQQQLGTPPEKDVGFPYESLYGIAVDRSLLSYSWQMYRVSQRRYSSWLDKGRPNPIHSEFANYLRWVCEQSGVQPRIGTVSQVRPNAGHLEITIDTETGNETLPAHGAVFTGPGSPIHINSANQQFPEDVLDGCNYWQRLPLFAHLHDATIGVIGAGETAASILVSLTQLATGRNVRIDLINRHGTLYTRGEHYDENKFFSRPELWSNMDEIEREEFIRRTDRGVFSVAAKRMLEESMFRDYHIITGGVTNITTSGEKICVVLERGRFAKSEVRYYDKVIVALGFDPFSPLTFLPTQLRPPKLETSKQRELLRRRIDYHLRLPLHEFVELDEPVNLHFPMLAGTAQGPGFPNLSCLGALADRILSAYAPP